MNLSPAYRRHLNAMGCFSVVTYSYGDFTSGEAGTEYVCKNLVAPLMASATHARLYPSAGFAKRSRNEVPALTPRKGFLEFELAEECVKGFEKFWSLGAEDGEYQRGTIVVVQPKGAPLARLLSNKMSIGVMASRHQILKGCSAAAIRYAEQHPRQQHRVFVFSASNGVQHLEIYPARHQIAAEFMIAISNGAEAIS